MRIPPPPRLFLIGMFAFASASLAQVGSPMSKPFFFQQAKPVWPRGRETEKNLSVGFRCTFDGEFFVDNVTRGKDGKLTVTRNRSEVCQYFAFCFGLATPATHGRLWERLRDQFGPERGKTKAFPEIHPANAFIGNYLRLELLSRYDRPDQALDEMRGFFRHMVARTGTLWENMDERASCNHGFASHVAWALVRDSLGIAEIDTVHRVIHLKEPARKLAWSRARLPVPGGFLLLERQGDQTQITPPAGWHPVER